MVEAETVHGEERGSDGEGTLRRSIGRRTRLVPPAITPLTLRDVVAGVRAHRRGEGRDAFRSALASRLDAESAGTYTSFRRAMAACLRALAAERGDRSTVLVPAFASPDFADAIEGVGLAVDRYDVDPETLSLDLDSLRTTLDDDVLAVAAVNVLGYSSPMEAVADLCTDAGVSLVEALGYAVGSTYRGDPLGTFGDCTAINFQQGKPIPVGGGMVTSRDPEVAFSDAGRPAVAPNVAALAGYAACSRPRPYAVYEAVSSRLADSDLLGDRVSTHPGSKLDVGYEGTFETMSNFQGAVGRRVLDRLDDHQRARERTAHYYAERLAGLPHVDHIRPVEGLGDHQHVRYPLLLDDSDVRTDVRRALRDVGVQASVLYDWPPIDEDRYPGAARLQREVLTLPTHPYVDDRDRGQIVETVRRVVGGR